MNQCLDARNTEYLNGDLDIPIFKKGVSEPMDTQIVASTILLKNFNKSQVANLNPPLCNINAAFIVNTTKLKNIKDIMCDQHGHWQHSKTKKYRFVKDGESVTKLDEDDILSTGDVICVRRLIYYHRNSRNFHRIIILLDGIEFAFMQYYFDNEEHSVRAEIPHGNARKDKKPYIRTKESVLCTIKESTETPKVVVRNLLEDAGGVVNIKGPGDIPKNRHQVSNTRCKRDKEKDDLIELVDLAKQEEKTDSQYIRDIKFVPEVSVFVASKQQLEDVSRFCTKPSNFCILGIDPTYNIGPFYVTVTTYRHLMFHTKYDVHPVMFGPTLIHSGKEYASYFDLPSGMAKANPNLKNILVFGTDSERNVYKTFQDVNPNAYHLLCDIHMKSNIKKKLGELLVCKENVETILTDVFGKTVAGIIEPGLVDKVDAFDKTVGDLMDKWREMGSAESSFADYFVSHKLVHIRNCMSADLRSMAGLGFPPSPYTQNANECINSVIKRGKETKKLSLKSVIQLLRSVVRDQENQVVLSLIGNGEWKLLPEYDIFKNKFECYYQMTAGQRSKLISQFNNLPVQGVNSASSKSNIAISADESGILYPPHSILSELFDNASKLLATNDNLIAAPGAPKGTYIVAFAKDAGNPLTVTADVVSGKVTCQSRCERYKSYKICEHCLAVAQKEQMIAKFVTFFKRAERQKRISNVVDVHKSKCAGKKASKATERRKGGMNTNRKEKDLTSYARVIPEKATREKNTAKTTVSSSTSFLKQATKPIDNVGKTDFTKDIVVRIGTSLPPKPPLPEPQAEPYVVKKREGNVKRCHGCGLTFNKMDQDLFVLCRKEMDWWPKVNKEQMTKSWALSNRTYYYCVSFRCIKTRRPTITKDNVSITTSTIVPSNVKDIIDTEF